LPLPRSTGSSDPGTSTVESKTQQHQTADPSTIPEICAPSPRIYVFETLQKPSHQSTHQDTILSRGKRRCRKLPDTDLHRHRSGSMRLCKAPYVTACADSSAGELAAEYYDAREDYPKDVLSHFHGVKDVELTNPSQRGQVPLPSILGREALHLARARDYRKAQAGDAGTR